MTTHPLLLRLIFDALLLLVLVLSPWWLTLILGLVAIFTFRDFYEALFVGLAFDLLYGPGHLTGETLRNFAGLLTAGLTLLLAMFVKTRLIVYNR